MDRHRLAAVALGICLVAGIAEAQTPVWRLGGRALYAPSGATSGELGDTGTNLELNSGGGLEFDATVKFSRLFAAEFTIAGVGQGLRLIGEGTGCCGIDGGTVWLIPVTATVQYHPQVFGPWDPYVGGGIGLIAPIYDISGDLEDTGITRLELDGGLGFVLQFGVGYQLDDDWSIGLDFRYLGVSLEARVGTEGTDYPPVTLDIKPWLVGFGVGYRF